MANVNISQVGNNVQLVEGGVIIALIPSRSFRFEPEEDGDFIIIRDYEARERVRQYQAAEVNDGTGTPVGTLDDIINYLAPFVGFNPAGGGGGEANTTSNAGGGQGLAKPKVGVDLPFKSITAGAGIQLTPSTNELEVATDGVVLTTTNQNVAGLKTFDEGQITLDGVSRGGSDQLLIGYNNADTFQGWDIRRSSAGGVLKLMSNATFPQIFIGSETNTTGEAYIDVDNNRRLNLNVLDTGAGRPAPVRVGQHGLQIVGITTATRDSGDLAFIVEGNVIYNNDLDAPQYYDGNDWLTLSGGAFGEYFQQANATETVIAAINTPVKIAGTSSVGEISALLTHTNGRLTYNGVKTRTFKIDGAITAIRGTGSGSPKFGFYIAKNGAVVAKTFVKRDIGNAEASVNIQGLITLAQNDFIEVFVENTTGTENLLVEALNVQAIQIS